MLNVEQAKIKYDEAQAIADASRAANDDLLQQWWKVEDEWRKKRDKAVNELDKARETAYIARADYCIALNNDAPRSLPMTRDEFKRMIRKTLSFRGTYTENRAGILMTHEERIVRYVESKQMELGGFKQLPYLLQEVHVIQRGANVPHEMTENQRKRVCLAIYEHCPKRADGGYALPYAIERDGKFHVTPVE